MKINDHIDLKGRMKMLFHNRKGELVKEVAADNDIVLTGRDLVAKLFINQQIDPISHLATGTGADEVDRMVDTALNNELFRKPIDPIDPAAHVTTTQDGKKKVIVTTELDFTESNGALTEAGLFNAAANGVMYNRVKFDEVNKTSDFKLTIVWEILF